VRHTSANGFTLLEMLVTIFIFAIMSAFAYPAFHRLRSHYAFSAATEDARQIIDRARWRSINSGEQTELVLTGNVLLMRDADTDAALSSVDLADNSVTASATNFPVTFDTRGFVAGTPPTLTIANTHISASRVLTISAVGRVS
jgi:prepilin-type N-terminal cleavage/methylation domain-containing protein